ncbi:MAG TPA: 3'-5' exonuclease, partial [Chitinophagales bacterium]|nr:3'-5' exonuclease [Chitinophagales bacterium]
IVAGPGSGKTRVLTYRIAHLLNKGVDSFSILALTFTNKASESMRSRIEKISGNNARNLYMGTFHSVFARILRVEATKIGYPANFTIYDTEDSKSLLKTIIKEQGLDDKIYKVGQVYNRISSAKNALITPEKYANDGEMLTEDRDQRRPETSKLYRLYCERCFKSGAMDFDDLLLNTFVILDKFPEVLYKYQHKFKYVLIDEFQDTNTLQYEIVRRISDVFQNITVVGDDAQSIYAFRGATIDNILNFEKDFPDLKVYKLEQNYRSTQNIVKAANELIHRNKNQLKKEIWTQNDKGDDIKIVRCPSDNEEGRWVADSIQEHKFRDQYKNNDFAILYRTNAQSRAFEEALRRHNIPYKIYGGMSFYQRKEVKDLLSYLKLTVNPNDEQALQRVINYPARGIGQTTLDKIGILAANEGKSMWQVMESIFMTDFPARTKNAIEEFVLMIKSFAVQQDKMNAYDLAAHVGRTTKLIAELYNDKTVEGINRFENIQELLNSIKEFVEDDEVITATTEDGGEAPIVNDRSLGSFLQTVTLLTGDEKGAENIDSVKMMTIHAAKGLEFPAVYVVGLEENLFPGTQSLYSLEDLEEERRLFYVAITRAETQLYLTYANTRYKFGQLNYCDPSRFLQEVPDNVVSYHGDLKKPKVHANVPQKTPISTFSRVVTPTSPKPTAQPTVQLPTGPFVPDDANTLQTGMEVLHEKFGEGKVVSIEGSGANKIASIFFSAYGVKKIMLKFAKVKILSGGQ